MDILRGKTPEMVRKEIWAHFLAYNLVRKIMAQSAMVHGRSPRCLSFKLALQTIKSFRNAGILSENNIDIYAQLLKAITYKQVGNRPGRSEPRRIKRRPKSFPLLQRSRNLYYKTKTAIVRQKSFVPKWINLFWRTIYKTSIYLFLNYGFPDNIFLENYKSRV